MSMLFTNNASGTNSVLLANEAGPSSLTLQTNEGALFPSPTGGDFFQCTIEDVSGNYEILRCTARATDVLTVVRGQESTSIQEFATGSRVELRNTAATFAEFIQQSGDQMTGELDMNNQVLRDPLVTDGEIRNAPIRGTDGGTGNQLLVPTAGGAPTIGGNTIIHTGNDTAYVQTTRTLTGGEGIAAIGDLSANRTIDLDITELTAMSGTDLAAADLILVYDVTGVAHKKILYRQAGVPIITDATTNPVPTDDQVNSYWICTNASTINFDVDTGIGEKGNVIIVEQGGAGLVDFTGGTATINSAFTNDTTRVDEGKHVVLCDNGCGGVRLRARFDPLANLVLFTTTQRRFALRRHLAPINHVPQQAVFQGLVVVLDARLVDPDIARSGLEFLAGDDHAHAARDQRV